MALPMIGDSYHCCQAEGEEIYQRFLMSTDTCTHNILLHPVCPTTLVIVLFAKLAKLCCNAA